MSSLDPLIGAQATEVALPYQRLAALAAGLPMPGGVALAASCGSGGSAVQLTITSHPQSSKGDRVSLDIVRAKDGMSATPAAKEKAAKAPKDKSGKEAAPKPAATPPPRAAVAGGISIGKVPHDEPPKLDPAEIAACQVPQEVSGTQANVATAAAKLGLSSAHFWRVRGDYYDQELSWRRDVLGASSVKQLCKSMIMEVGRRRCTRSVHTTAPRALRKYTASLLALRPFPSHRLPLATLCHH